MQLQDLTNRMTPVMLSHLVDDAASNMASHANNSGIEQQIEFLKQAGNDEDTICKKLMMDFLEEGMSVFVTPPLYEDSQHTQSFKGDIVEINPEVLKVRDASDNVWDIRYNEVFSF